MISQQTNISVAIVPVMLATGLKCASSNFSCDSDDSDDDFHAQASDASKENAFRSGLVSRKTDFGERVSKDPQGKDHEFNHGGTHFIYDTQGNLIAEADSFGGISREYVYLGNLLIAVLDGNDVYYVSSDHIGTPQKMTDGDQRVVWSRVAEPFGETTRITGPATLNLRAPGQYYDSESGLLYNLMRSINPRIGRGTQSDPTGLLGGINTYAYVGNNPVRFIDPFGLDTQYNGSGGFTFALPGFGFGGSVSVGWSVPTNTGNIPGYEVLVTVQGNAMTGLGAYAGAGLSGGQSTSVNTPTSSTSSGVYGEADIGPFGVSGQAETNNGTCTSQNPTGGLTNPGGSVGLPIPRTGGGVGAWVGGGGYGSATYAIPVGSMYQTLFGNQ